MKQFIFIGAVVGLIAVAFLTRGTDVLGQTVASRPQMSEQAFKNIQVLKGIPVDEFMGTMGLFSAALSVCCGDCHTGAGGSNPQWEADPPRKQVARRMVLDLPQRQPKTIRHASNRSDLWRAHPLSHGCFACCARQPAKRRSDF
jgi:hypothetical protein